MMHIHQHCFSDDRSIVLVQVSGPPKEARCHKQEEGGFMPLVRIDLVSGKSKDYQQQVGEVVYQSLVCAFNVPVNDRFQVITEHPLEQMPFDRDYLGVHRTDDCIFIQITLNNGRDVELKKVFYKAVADGLHQAVKLRREDVFISLVEVPKENWSFGNGEAQYA
jgi:4-oxalocrotonate tautomerase